MLSVLRVVSARGTPVQASFIQQTEPPSNYSAFDRSMFGAEMEPVDIFVTRSDR